MAVFVYVDETIFTIDSKTNEIGLGCGVFVSQNEIAQEVVEEALNNLINDADFDSKKDQRTIKRNYFHASDDSKNAHSHFCNSIRSHISGIFNYTYFDGITQADTLKKRFVDKMFDRCLDSSTLELFCGNR